MKMKYNLAILIILLSLSFAFSLEDFFPIIANSYVHIGIEV